MEKFYEAVYFQTELKQRVLKNSTESGATRTLNSLNEKIK